MTEAHLSALTEQSALIQAFAEKQGLSLAAIQGQQTTLVTGSETLQKGMTTVEQKIDGLENNMKRVENKVNDTAVSLKTSHDEIMRRLNTLPADLAKEIVPELLIWQSIGQKIDELFTLLDQATADLLKAIDRAAAKYVAPPVPPSVAPDKPTVPDPLAKPDTVMQANTGTEPKANGES